MPHLGFGDVTTKCDEDLPGIMAKVDAGAYAVSSTDDALRRVDASAWQPRCVSDTTIAGQKGKLMVYEKKPNIWLWVSVGLAGLLVLLLLVMALSSSSSPAGTPIVLNTG